MSGSPVREREAVREADLALARSALYRVLAQALAYPTRDAVARLRREDLPLAEALADLIGLGRPVAEVAGRFRGVSFRRLEAAYRGVFSVVESPDCPLHETEYMTQDIFRKSQAMADVAGFYRAFGVDGSEDERVRPDHAAAELEFMHLLAYKEAWAAARGEEEGLAVCRRAEEAFLRDHLGRWLPELGRRVEALAGETPYAPVGRLAWAFVEDELGRFGVAVSPHGAPSGEPDPDPPALCEGA